MSSAVALGRKYLIDEAHCQHVATLALSLFVWVTYIGVGLKHNGLGYFGHLLWPPGVPTALKPLVGLIEFVSTILEEAGYEGLPIYREPFWSPTSAPGVARLYPYAGRSARDSPLSA